MKNIFRIAFMIWTIFMLVGIAISPGIPADLNKKSYQYNNEFDGKKIILFGRISNLNLDKENNVIEFNANDLNCIFFVPLHVIHFYSAERIMLKGRILGFITPSFIFGISNFKSFDKYTLFFCSNVVNLLNYSIYEKHDEQDNIVKLFLSGSIENKLNEIINCRLIAEFYDKDNIYIGEKTFTIFGLREKGKPGSSTTFTITYDGEFIEYIRYVKLYGVRLY